MPARAELPRARRGAGEIGEYEASMDTACEDWRRFPLPKTPTHYPDLDAHRTDPSSRTVDPAGLQKPVVRARRTPASRQERKISLQRTLANKEVARWQVDRLPDGGDREKVLALWDYFCFNINGVRSVQSYGSSINSLYVSKVISHQSAKKSLNFV